jgi:hypothetical protein
MEFPHDLDAAIQHGMNPWAPATEMLLLCWLGTISTVAALDVRH